MAKLTYKIADGSGVTLQGASMAHLEGLRDRDPARAGGPLFNATSPMLLGGGSQNDEGHLDMPVMNFDEESESGNQTHSDSGQHLDMPTMKF